MDKERLLAKSAYLKAVNTMLLIGIESQFFPIAETTSYEFAIALLECIKLSKSLVEDISEIIETGVDEY